MKAAGERCRPLASVSASELAQLGVCERLVVFEHRHGKDAFPSSGPRSSGAGANTNGSIVKGG